MAKDGPAVGEGTVGSSVRAGRAFPSFPRKRESILEAPCPTAWWLASMAGLREGDGWPSVACSRALPESRAKPGSLAPPPESRADHTSRSVHRTSFGDERRGRRARSGPRRARAGGGREPRLRARRGGPRIPRRGRDLVSGPGGASPRTMRRCRRGCSPRAADTPTFQVSRAAPPPSFFRRLDTDRIPECFRDSQPSSPRMAVPLSTSHLQGRR